MKYVICYSAAFILLIPAFTFGLVTFIWNPTKEGFKKGPQWLNKKFNYGKLISNLLED